MTPHTKAILLRLTPKELRAIDREAKAVSLDRSTWIRYVLGEVVKGRRHEHRFVTTEEGAALPCECGEPWRPTPGVSS